MCICAQHNHRPHQVTVQDREDSQEVSNPPTPRQPGAPSDTGCAHDLSTPHQHLPHGHGCGTGTWTRPLTPGTGTRLDQGSQDPSSPETKSYQNGGAASL